MIHYNGYTVRVKAIRVSPIFKMYHCVKTKIFPTQILSIKVACEVFDHSPLLFTGTRMRTCKDTADAIHVTGFTLFHSSTVEENNMQTNIVTWQRKGNMDVNNAPFQTFRKLALQMSYAKKKLIKRVRPSSGLHAMCFGEKITSLSTSKRRRTPLNRRPFIRQKIGNQIQARMHSQQNMPKYRLAISTVKQYTCDISPFLP